MSQNRAHSRAVATIDLTAITHNVRQLSGLLQAKTRLCAVIKADGYGHGITYVASAAIAGGATQLAVATLTEAKEVRAKHADVPILVLGPLTTEELQVALDINVEVVAFNSEFVDLLIRLEIPARVHVKLDTGMGRYGTRNAEEATMLCEKIHESPQTTLAGAMTHFATADEQEDEFFHRQLNAFQVWALPLKARFPTITLHTANSAAMLRTTKTHFDMVRPGIALYGIDPFGVKPLNHQLQPVLRLTSYVAALKSCAAGESVGYGRRYIAQEDTTIATIPIGYGDGFRRAFTNNASVLIGGFHYPVVGTVSMDAITVEVQKAQRISVGDEVVIIGRQGSQRIFAEGLARAVDTIGYEIVCGLTSRVERTYQQ